MKKDLLSNKDNKNRLSKFNDNNVFNHKKLSSYILKNKKKEEKNKLRNSAKSYDNSAFKAKIKLVKKKKRPKRRNKTFDDNILDKPNATPIKKEKDKGGKVDLELIKRYNTINSMNIMKKPSKNIIINSEDFNHQINVNIKNIKNNLKKIILIQKWWKKNYKKK